MSRYTKQDIMRLVEEEEVQFIRLQFTDLFGTLKNVAISASQLERALDNKCMFDGSSIEGFARMGERDMYLYPDLNTFDIFPFRQNKGKIARLICDVYRPNGTPFEADPRFILKNQLKRAADMGYRFNVGLECEFFLFDTDQNGKPVTDTFEKAGYFDISPLDFGESVRRDIILNLEQMGFEIEASHHEIAPAQHEIDLRYTNALRAADNFMTFKLAAKSIAQEHGMFASFMPKPVYGVCGSGLRVNMSLAQDGVNLFNSYSTSSGVSKEAYHFIAGIMDHIKGMTVITNPLVNSYKRLLPGFDAPMFIAWSEEQNSPLIRIPAARGTNMRIEFRLPDPAANPYLLLAVCLAAGLDGIERELHPPKCVEKDFYEMSKEEAEEMGIDAIPSNLSKACHYFEDDEFIQEVLGETAHKKYLKVKRNEWNQFREQVTAWEIEEYLYKI